MAHINVRDAPGKKIKIVDYGLTPRPPNEGESSSELSNESTEILTYPLNVDDNPHQGHYIIFEIMKQNKDQLLAQQAINSVGPLFQQIVAEIGAPAEDAVANAGPGESGPYDFAKKVTQERLAAGITTYTGPNSIQVAQRATTVMPVCIALYMPPSVQVSYNADYNQQEIGLAAEAVNAGIRAFMAEEGSFGQKFAAGGEAATGGLGAGIWRGAKEKLPTGGEAMFAIHSGSVITPRMELMFEGIQRRSFSFNFTFIPKSEPEANIVHRIVYLFKYHMASNYGGIGMGGVDGIREMEIPDFFNIRYMYLNKENPHLNKIKQCVLTGATVEYGADRYKAYKGGVPQTTKLSLNFSELEIITKDYIKQGY